MREYHSRANGGQRAQARPAPRHLTRRTTSTSKHSRCGGCIPSRLLRKCSAATSSRLQAGGHRVGALLRAHGLGRASEERFQGKRLGRQQSSVLAAYLMARLLLMMIRLEMLLKAPARGWGDGCLNSDDLMRKVSHPPKAGRDPEDSRFCGEGARASRRAVHVFLVSAAAALPAVALGAPPGST